MQSTFDLATVAGSIIAVLLGALGYTYKLLAKARAGAQKVDSTGAADALLTEMTRQRDRLEDDVRDWRKAHGELQKEIRDVEQRAVREVAALRETVEECERRSDVQTREIKWQQDQIVRLDKRLSDLLRSGGNQQ